MRDTDSEIRNELLAGERLLWTGQPRQGVVFRAADFFLIPFSIFWGGFAIFWVVGVMLAGGGVFALFGLPFVAMGLYIMVGRFWVDARQRANTFYGITADRIIIVSGAFRRQSKSLNLGTISDVSLTEYSNGRGLITFGPTMPMFASMQGFAWPGMSQFMPPCFELASDGREVYQMINAARAAGREKE